MAAQSTSVKVTTPKFRVSFPHLAEAHAMDASQTPKFSVTMLFSKKSDITWAKESINKALLLKFGSKEKIPKGMKNPLRDGDAKESAIAGYEGHYYICARSADRPGTVDEDCNEIIHVKEELYAGSFARASIAFYCFEKAGNRGVACALNNVQKLGDGEKFSGKSSAKDDFGGSSKPDTGELSEDLLG